MSLNSISGVGAGAPLRTNERVSAEQEPGAALPHDGVSLGAGQGGVPGGDARVATAAAAPAAGDGKAPAASEATKESVLVNARSAFYENLRALTTSVPEAANFYKKTVKEVTGDARLSGGQREIAVTRAMMGFCTTTAEAIAQPKPGSTPEENAKVQSQFERLHGTFMAGKQLIESYPQGGEEFRPSGLDFNAGAAGGASGAPVPKGSPEELAAAQRAQAAQQNHNQVQEILSRMYEDRIKTLAQMMKMMQDTQTYITSIWQAVAATRAKVAQDGINAFSQYLMAC